MKALLVDGLNLARRIYAAVSATPTPAGTEQDETHNGTEDSSFARVITTTTASLQRALNQHQPSHALVVFDHIGPTWRHRYYPDYKKNRAPMPQPLGNGLARLEQAFGEMKVACFALDGFEADDIIATIACKVAARGGRAVILSTDRHYCQLLQPNIAVFDHFAQRPLDAAMVSQKFQVAPQQLPDLLALAGDSSASIPGVKSIGLRTATKLIAEYHTLEKTLAIADGQINSKTYARLQSGREDARLAKTLFTLKTDIDIGLNLSQLRYQPAGAARPEGEISG